MSKQLADQILQIQHAPGTSREYSAGFDDGVACAAQTVLAAPSSRPWKATAEEVESEGDAADASAYRAWVRQRLDKPIAQCTTYEISCVVADAIVPPPTFRAGVIADFLDDCWERGSPPTPEEIEPFLRPKVLELVWDGQFAHATTVLDYCVYETATGLWNADLESGEAGGPILWQRIGFDSRELAQAAAQAHWDARATAFYREAFE